MMRARELLLQITRSLTIAVLSTILPLSFLLLARLSLADLFITFNPQPTYSSFIISILTDTPIPIAHNIVLLITLLALLPILTQRSFRLPLYQSWILLCCLQACVGFGIEPTAPFRVPTLPTKGIFLRLLFFAGLYEVTVFWTCVAVRPTVDDTIYGDAEAGLERRWPSDHVAGGLALGALWWWRLRGELELLGGIVEMKKQMFKAVGMSDMLCLLVYYATIAVGLATLIAWIAKAAVNCRLRRGKTTILCPASDGNV